MLLEAIFTLTLSGQALQPPPAATSGAPAEDRIDQIAAPQDDEKQERKQEQKQETQAKKPPTPERTGIKALFGNLAGDYTHLAHRDNFYVAAVGGGLAI